MKKLVIILLVIAVSGYLYAGYYVYNIAGSVPCAVWEGEQSNSPSNFTIWSEEYDIDPEQKPDPLFSLLVSQCNKNMPLFGEQ